MDETIKAFRNFYASGEEAAKFDLVNIINELVLIVRPELNSHGIELKFAHEGGKYELKSVASYVRQILLLCSQTPRTRWLIADAKRRKF